MEAEPVQPVLINITKVILIEILKLRLKMATFQG